MYHYAPQSILDPTHPLDVHLVGAGGTGSLVLNELGRVDYALRSLGHPGLHLTVYDPDTVSEANIGRQLFSPVDVGESKARVIVERVNRFYGLSWGAIPDSYTFPPEDLPKILITAVDTAKARVEIGQSYIKELCMYGDPRDFHSFYWLDMGNRQKDGQAVLGTIGEMPTPKDTESAAPGLATILDLFPDLTKEDRRQAQGPSCSLGEALSRQDLFVNRAVATFGCNILWRLFREARISICGCFVNLDGLRANPLTVKQSVRYLNSKDDRQKEAQ